MRRPRWRKVQCSRLPVVLVLVFLLRCVCLPISVCRSAVEVLCARDVEQVLFEGIVGVPVGCSAVVIHLCDAIPDVGPRLGFLVLHQSLLSVRLSFYHNLGLGSGPNSDGSTTNRFFRAIAIFRL